MQHLLDLAYRTFYRVAFALARLAWQLGRPRHEGALAAIFVGSDILMVRQSYRRAQSLPGGGVKAGEAPQEAVRREVEEELGIALEADSLFHVHTQTGLWDGRRDTVHFFEARLAVRPALRIDRREILRADFVPVRSIDRARVTGPVAAYLDWARAGQSGA